MYKSIKRLISVSISICFSINILSIVTVKADNIGERINYIDVPEAIEIYKNDREYVVKENDDISYVVCEKDNILVLDKNRNVLFNANDFKIRENINRITQNITGGNIILSNDISKSSSYPSNWWNHGNPYYGDSWSDYNTYSLVLGLVLTLAGCGAVTSAITSIATYISGNHLPQVWYMSQDQMRAFSPISIEGRYIRYYYKDNYRTMLIGITYSDPYQIN